MNRNAMILLLFALLLASGCTGSANNHAIPFDPVKGHPANFVTTHPTFAMPDSSGCMPCHGADLLGGTSGVSCATASFNGIACHTGGPGHGTQAWVDNVHFLRAKANLASCQLCHGADLRGSGTAVSCYAASFVSSTGVPFGACHTNGPDHLLLAATWVVNSAAVPDTVSAHHTATFVDNGASCRPCHGATLLGGNSGVSCSTPGRSGFTCHAAGPAFHAARWLDFTALGNQFHGGVYLNTGNADAVCGTCHQLSTKCLLCHFVYNVAMKVPVGSTWSHPIAGATDPTHHQFTDNAVISVCVNCHATHNRFGQQPVCHNCHPPFPGSASGHVAGWQQAHAPAARAGTLSCGAQSGPPAMTCHGTNLVGGSGPACNSPLFGGVRCHAGQQPVTAHLNDCLSCHASPPSSAGVPTGYPNIAGAHARYVPLAGVTCATCHTGAGIGTTVHDDNTDLVKIQFASGYNAQTGTLAYTGAATRTCTGVICHGGQTTPDARRTPATLACTACHRSRITASPQFNDLVNTAFSDHTNHFGRGCTNCHDMTLVSHWGSLTDRGIPAGRARASIVSRLNYSPPGGSQSNCTTTGIGNCH